MSRPCAIHDDAHGTRHVCERCRRDPANSGWHEASELEVGVEMRADDRPVRLGEVAAREYTAVDRAVALGIWLGRGNRQIAREVGVSEGLVRRIRRRFMS